MSKDGAVIMEKFIVDQLLLELMKKHNLPEAVISAVSPEYKDYEKQLKKVFKIFLDMEKTPDSKQEEAINKHYEWVMAVAPKPVSLEDLMDSQEETRVYFGIEHIYDPLERVWVLKDPVKREVIMSLFKTWRN